MKFVALVPLRGGSKSIPSKNVKEIAGKPLCTWVLDAALRCGEINEVWVSTDSENIKTVVNRLSPRIKILNRPENLAMDGSSTESVLMHFVENVEFDALITIQATSPQLLEQDLRVAIRHFIEKDADSLLSAVRMKRFFWADDSAPLNYDPSERPRRQDWEGTLVENGAFYITRRAILKQHECRLAGKIVIHEMDEEGLIEIDELEDWHIVEGILERREKLARKKSG